jgi:hypothetical protein
MTISRAKMALNKVLVMVLVIWQSDERDKMGNLS